MIIKAHYIILESSVILTKKYYNEWRDIQSEYKEYKTSLGPWTCEECIEYFSDDFKDEENWPFSRKRIKQYFLNNELILFESGNIEDSLIENIRYQIPWQNENHSTFDNLQKELDKEIHEKHLLWGKKLNVIARRDDRDDVLVHIVEDKITAIVHLTWKIKKENGNYPQTKIFSNINELNDKLAYDKKEYEEES